MLSDPGCGEAWLLPVAHEGVDRTVWTLWAVWTVLCGLYWLCGQAFLLPVAHEGVDRTVEVLCVPQKQAVLVGPEVRHQHCHLECAVCSVQCVVCSVLCAVCTVQCVVCSV